MRNPLSDHSFSPRSFLFQTLNTQPYTLNKVTVENRPFQLSNQSHTAFRASATTPEPCTPNPHPKSKLCVGARPHAPPPPPFPTNPPRLLRVQVLRNDVTIKTVLASVVKPAQR